MWTLFFQFFCLLIAISNSVSTVSSNSRSSAVTDSGPLVESSVSDLPSTTYFKIHQDHIIEKWDHYWERCVGSGHALTALRSDWRSQLAQTHDDLGFQYVRFHGIFVDDMSVVLPSSSSCYSSSSSSSSSSCSSSFEYSFYNIFSIYDFLLSIGMKPLVEISFMPKLFASGNQTWAHFEANVTPPSSYSTWASFITTFIQALVDRYTLPEVLLWPFEIWNEPNCCPHDFWTGTQLDYFVFFNWTYNAIKAVDPGLKVGGPATAQSAWIKDFLKWTFEQGIEVDFVSTHEYPTDPPGPQSREFFSQVLRTTRDLVGKDIPLYYTEYDDGYNDATGYAAAFIASTVFSSRGLVDILSWWPFSDIFEEGGLHSNPFSSSNSLPVAGLQNIYGIPKPSYRAFQLLHWTGDSLLQTSPDFFYYDTVSLFATKGNGTSIFVMNWDVYGKPIGNVVVNLEIFDVPLKNLKLAAYLIDNNNSNALPTWQQMGEPFYLTASQVTQLQEASSLVPFPLSYSISSNVTVVIEFEMTPYSLLNIVMVY